jgi:hypothetical protein
MKALQQSPTPQNLHPQESLRRLWQMDSCFKCPLLSLCLTPTEQRQLLKKARIVWKGKTPFQIHEILVSCSDDENNLSRKIDSYLQHKFKKRTEPIRRLDQKGFLQHWKACFSSGQFLDVLWAAAARGDLSPEVRQEIFGDIHMAMHQTAADHAKARQSLDDLRRQLDAKERKIEGLKQRVSDLLLKNKLLSEELIAREAKLSALIKEIDGLRLELQRQQGQSESELARENLRLKEVLVLKETRVQEARHESERLKQTVEALTRSLEKQKQLQMRLKTELASAVRIMKGVGQCDPDCPAFDLCRKRILVVGGISRMESLYRRFIEDRGGIFDYHDGYMNNGSRRLEHRVRRADIVLCPVNCNSHAACSLVKNLGKKHNKPVHMLPSFSLSAIFQVLRDAAGGTNPNPVPPGSAN